MIAQIKSVVLPVIGVVVERCVVKRTFADFGQTVGYIDFGKLCTAFKLTAFDALNVLANSNAIQP